MGSRSGAGTFGAALDKLPKPAPERRSRFHPEDEDEQEEGQDPKWLVKDLIQERSTVLWCGPTQSYKSFLALDLALGIAAARETFGCVPEAGPVFYAALEGKSNIKRARRRAWRLAREIEGKIENFYVLTAPLIGVEDERQEFGDQIRAVVDRVGLKPKLIVIDTASKSLAGLDENDAGDVNRLIGYCESLIEVFGCAVLVIHHTAKDKTTGYRGSGAFHANFDTFVEVKADLKSKAVQVRVVKHKDAEERELPWTFQGRLIGPSLVFFPTTPDEHDALTVVEDGLEPKKVGAALRGLGAIGEQNSVTTQVLAQALLQGQENETPEQRATALGGFCKKLGAQSRGRLRAYTALVGDRVAWCLPSEPSA